MAESHKFCNAFSLIVIGRGSDDGELFNCNGERFDIIQGLRDQISKIPTLLNKPKFLLIQRYVTGINIFSMLFFVLYPFKTNNLVMKVSHTSSVISLQFIFKQYVTFKVIV